MNSSLRALSLVFASAALMLGPGQAIAGGDHYDDWSGPDINNLDACFDRDRMVIRYRFDLRDDSWYNDHEDYYDDDLYVEAEFFDAEAVCAKFPGNGKGKGIGLVKYVDIGGYCADDRAHRINGCEYVGEIYLDDEDICFGNRHLVDIDADKLLFRIGGYEVCEAYL